MCACTRTIILLTGDSGARHPADFSRQSPSSKFDHCQWLMNMCYEQDPLRIPGEQKGWWHSPWMEGTQDALCHPGLTQCHSRQGPSIRRDARLRSLTTIPICHWITYIPNGCLYSLLASQKNQDHLSAKQARSNFHSLLASHTLCYETLPLLKKHF